MKCLSRRINAYVIAVRGEMIIRKAAGYEKHASALCRYMFTRAVTAEASLCLFLSSAPYGVAAWRLGVLFLCIGAMFCWICYCRCCCTRVPQAVRRCW